MIQHYLYQKRVTWQTLERIQAKRCVDFQRITHRGIVVDVDCTNTLAAVRKDSGDIAEVAICDLDQVEA